ncbi:MAG: threonine synthase [Halobacteriaceae archaeon]
MTELPLGLDPDGVSAAAEDGVWLTCIECGETHPPFDAPLYRCPDCDGLLEVRYATYPTFDEFDGEGVWRYRDTLPLDEGVSVGEGSTPLIEVPDLAADLGVEDLRVKHEGANPTGSFKDRGMTLGVAIADRLGVERLACASTGNTSAALACYGARAGLDVAVLLPQGKVAAGKLAQASLHGARTLALDGNFDACLDIVATLADRGEIYLLNSLNPMRLEGQKTIGLEILESMRAETGTWPDRIVLPVGNAGNTAALYKCFRELIAAGEMTPEEMPALTGVQASGAAPLVAAIEDGADTVDRWPEVETRATAIRIGDPVNAPKALPGIRASGGTAVAVDDDAITDAQRALAAAGVGVEPASAASLAGLRALRNADVVSPDERVVCLTTGHLLKDPDAAVAAGTDPVDVPATVEAVLGAM